MTKAEVLDEAWRLATNPLCKESVRLAFSYVWNCAIETMEQKRKGLATFDELANVLDTTEMKP